MISGADASNWRRCHVVFLILCLVLFCCCCCVASYVKIEFFRIEFRRIPFKLGVFCVYTRFEIRFLYVYFFFVEDEKKFFAREHFITYFPTSFSVLCDVRVEFKEDPPAVIRLEQTMRNDPRLVSNIRRNRAGGVGWKKSHAGRGGGGWFN